MRAIPATVLVAAAGALTCPVSAWADATITADDGFAFGNANPTIEVGQKVVWTFANPGVQHNVAATSGNWSFRSGDLSVNHGSHEFTFTAPGSYSYVCELHAPGMAGTVTVLAPGQAPPPPGTPPPAPPGTPPPVPPPDNQGFDRERPQLTAVSVKRTRRAARVRFLVSETATVTLRLRGAGSVRTLRAQVKAGRRSVLVRRLRAARYTLELQARDAAGNRSGMRRATVRRPR
jgi:plastocyanin